ncbi:putative splicing factor 3A subunit 1-like, partial [Trifolium medium]|nr:putative splicing factor 3A subunit 1-like [Trifolium medium]
PGDPALLESAPHAPSATDSNDVATTEKPDVSAQFRPVRKVLDPPRS